MSSPVHVDNKKRYILILAEGPTQGLDDNTLTAEKNIQLILLKMIKKFYLSLHFNETSSYLFVNRTEIIKFKAKDSEIVATPLCLGNYLDLKCLDLLKTSFCSNDIFWLQCTKMCFNES